MTKPFLKTAIVLGLVAAGCLAVVMPASAANWRHGFGAHGGSRDVNSTRTYTAARQTDCGRYACANTGTITGPNGGSDTTSGWWRR